MYFIGVRLWDAEVWIDPEFNQGFGLSNTEGIAGFPSGASFKVGSAVPYARLSVSNLCLEGHVRLSVRRQSRL
jgi:hypothetical protein